MNFKVAALDLGYGAGVADVVAAKPKVQNVQQSKDFEEQAR